MARHLAEGGAGVIGTYHRSRDEADELVAEIAETGGRATALHLDVRRTDGFADFATAVQRTLRGTEPL
jgi:NAD(P)-dependent dehydrogenase (short-subunit alcohol dehydrogenase family)